MIKPWKTLSSEQTYKDRYLSIRTDRCQHESGHVVPTYHVVEFTDWATLVPITDQGNVVLIREYRHPAGEVFIGLPGGMSEPGETDYEQVAARELHEETGYRARELMHIGTCYPNPAVQNNRLHYYLALGCAPISGQNLDPNEEIEVLEMPYEDFLDFEAMPHQHALHAAALFYAERYFRKFPQRRP